MSKQKKRKKRPHKKITANLGLQKYFNIYSTPLERKLDTEFTSFLVTSSNELIDDLLNGIIKCNSSFEQEVNIKLKTYRDEISKSILTRIQELIKNQISFEEFETKFTAHLSQEQFNILEFLNNSYHNIVKDSITNTHINKRMTDFTSRVSATIKSLLTQSPTEVFHSRLAARATTATRVLELNIAHLLQYANANVNDMMLNFYTTFNGFLVEAFRTVMYENNLENVEFKSNEIINEQLTTPREYKHRSWRELNALAIDNGYELDRCNGDHAIYINKDGKVVIIPQGRDIGKGLQIAILKDMENS